jgi:hypothetical protein
MSQAVAFIRSIVRPTSAVNASWSPLRARSTRSCIPSPSVQAGGYRVWRRGRPIGSMVAGRSFRRRCIGEAWARRSLECVSADTSGRGGLMPGSGVWVPDPSAPGVTDLHTRPALGGIRHLE